MTGLLADIAADSRFLDPRRGERGMVHGRRSSTPVSRRAPADLDALVLTDPRTGVLATLMHWANRVRYELRLPRPAGHTIRTEVEVLSDHWAWATAELPGLEESLASLRDVLYEFRHGAKLRRCPVCGEPVRIDRFSIEHRTCIDQPV